MESKILNQKISPVQTQRFGIALLEAIKDGVGSSVEVLSVAPILDFPYSGYVVAPGAIWSIAKGIKAKMIPFINIFVLKHLSRFVGTFIYVYYWSLKNFSHKKVIIMHGVQSCKLWGVLLGQLLSPTTTISYLTDDLGMPAKWEGVLKKGFRKLDVILMKIGLRRVTGVIAMTPWLAESLAPDRRCLIMNGILNTSEHDFGKWEPKRGSIFRIVYSGGLYSEHGIDLLLQAFNLANQPDWRLLITGYGDKKEVIRYASMKNPCIEYKGFLSTQELFSLYRSADVLVNPRLTATKLARMAFPSKLVEYLGTGKPVVSTLLPSMNDELKKHLVIASSDTPAELLRCLETVASWEIDELRLWHERTKQFIRENLAPPVQGRKIREFIESLMSQQI
jgi:glycosyltransferase involved in cell wall biosynthesis